MRVDALFSRDQSAERAVDVIFVIAQWDRLVFNDDAGLQRTLQQV